MLKHRIPVLYDWMDLVWIFHMPLPSPTPDRVGQKEMREISVPLASEDRLSSR
jgi:hypothetical protein